MTGFIIADPGIAAALLSRHKTQMRIVTHGPLARTVPGDRIRVRESCITARGEAGNIHATARARAELVVFADGWRQYRDGRRERGRRPTDPDRQWVAAMHMPAWASRTTLVVEWVRRERLQQITRDDIRAEGALPLLGGLLWRWPRPIKGVHRSGRAAFARYWDLIHSPGERWEDDPEVIVIGFRVETNGQ